MRLKSLHIQNLRSFRDETIEFDAYTTLVGANGSGKSTVLCALNILFRDSADSPLNLLELQAEDFHAGNTSESIRVTATFTDLSDAAQQDFAGYCRQDKLVITAKAEFDEATGRAPVLQFGQRKVMKEFARYFEADKEKAPVTDLRTIYAELKKQLSDLPKASTKKDMTEALRAYEESHPDRTALVESEDQFYGVSKGANRLAQHVQWVYVPAVKDVSTEQVETKETALGRLLARTVRARTSFRDEVSSIREDATRRYDAMLEAQQGTLTSLSESLRGRLAHWSHPGAELEVLWRQEQDKSVRISEPSATVVIGESGFRGNIARMGHGLQRAYLLAILQELATATTEAQPTLILGVEEPELYQHPPQCRHLSAVLQSLAETGSQIILTTHSPLFVESRMFSGLRLVRKAAGDASSTVNSVPLNRLRDVLRTARNEDPVFAEKGTLAKIHQSLQPTRNEIFFAPFVVLVEGREDLAYILSYMTLVERDDDLRRVGCHFVAADGKSKMAIPLIMTRELSIPTFAVFDADTDVREDRREQQRIDNRALVRILGADEAAAWPDETVWTTNLVVWQTSLAAEVQSEVEREAWDALKAEVELHFGQVGGLEKNPLFIAELLDRAWDRGLRFPKLERLCNAILDFCSANQQDSAISEEQGQAAESA